jgi:hypothetical protein
MKISALISLHACAFLLTINCTTPTDVEDNPATPPAADSRLLLAYTGCKEIYKKAVRTDSPGFTSQDFDDFSSFSHCDSITIKNTIAYWFFDGYVAGCSTSTTKDTVKFRYFALFDSSLTLISTLDVSQSLRLPGTFNGFSGEHLIIYSYNDSLSGAKTSLDPFADQSLGPYLAANDSTVVLRMRFLAGQPEVL